MHSSRMRTAHLLLVSPSMHCSGGCTCPGSVGVPARGVYLPGGVYLPSGVVYLPRGVVYLPGGVPAQVPPPVDRILDTRY